jgi:hypothetical protein
MNKVLKINILEDKEVTIGGTIIKWLFLWKYRGSKRGLYKRDFVLI